MKRSPQEWLNEKRMTVACQMLLLGEPVKRVAIDLGFKQVSHFCRSFKKRQRMTPREFVLSKMEKGANCASSGGDNEFELM
jgi:AraC-like DNA-binding protein